MSIVNLVFELCERPLLDGQAVCSHALSLSASLCRLVGVTDLCSFPQEALDKPKASRTIIDTSVLSMEEVEAKMQQCKADGQPPFTLDEDLIARQQPGLILAQDSCQTCDPSASQVYQVKILWQKDASTRGRSAIALYHLQSLLEEPKPFSCQGLHSKTIR